MLSTLFEKEDDIKSAKQNKDSSGEPKEGQVIGIHNNNSLASQ